MRTRQVGGVRKQRGRWIGLWYEHGVKKSKVLGLVKEMTKGDAREAVAEILATERAKSEGRKVWRFGEFVSGVYFPFYCRKWKGSTAGVNKNRIMMHLEIEFASRPLASIQRDELQDLLDRKSTNLSFSMVDHLRWDMKQIFDMAMAEGLIERNPALLLWTPRGSRQAKRDVMTAQDVQMLFLVLATREKIIAMLAILAGMRPGEIFALKWGDMSKTSADIKRRVYRGVIDCPKTYQSIRSAALPEQLLYLLDFWKKAAPTTDDDAWVFPSERMTPLAKENVWRRHMKPRLEEVSLQWATFQVMRRTHATLMNALGVEGKLVADQLGHSLDVNQNVYTKSAVATRQVAVNLLETSIPS